MDDFGNELAAPNLQQINTRFDKGAQRMAAIERNLQQATQELHATRQELQQLRCMLDEVLDEMLQLLEFFRSMKGAFRVLRWIGKLAAPITAIIGLGIAVAAAWTAARGGRP